MRCFIEGENFCFRAPKARCEGFWRMTLFAREHGAESKRTDWVSAILVDNQTNLLLIEHFGKRRRPSLELYRSDQ